MISILFSVLMLAASPSATTLAATPAPDAASEAPAAERKICRREMKSESRLAAKRTCLTAAEWKARDTGVKGLSDHSK